MIKIAPSLQTRLADLRRGFASKLDDRLGGLEQQITALQGADAAAQRDGLIALHMNVHKLHGAAATFDYPALSSAAQGMDSALGFLLDQDTLSASDLGDLPAFCTALADARRRDEDSPPAPAVIDAAPLVSAAASPSGRIFVVEDDEEQGKRLVAMLALLDFDPVWFGDLDSFRQRLAQETPLAVVMDILFPDEDLAGTDIIKDLRAQGELTCPVVFVSSLDDFEARLDTIRAGGNGYLVKPITATDLGNTLAHITMTTDDNPYRVLVLDDDEDMIDYYTSILEAAGIVVDSLARPEAALDRLKTFQPDVIITDINMPGCNGYELANLVHQHISYLHIPIIFITADTSPVAHVMSLRSSGNDFLRKPVSPDILLSSVNARAERARLVRSVGHLEQIKESEQRFQQLADNIEEMFWMSNAERTRILYASPAFETIWHRPTEKLYEDPGLLIDTLHPDDRAAYIARRATTAGAPMEEDFRIVRPDGDVRHIRCKSMAVVGPSGTVEKIVGIATDITDKKDQEKELERRVELRTSELAEATDEIEEANERMEAIIANTAEGIITIDAQGSIHTFNIAAERLFGYTADEVMGRDVSVLLPTSERSGHRAYVQGSNLYESRIINKARDLTGLRKNGTEFPLELNVAPMRVGGEKMFVGILHDISDRKRAEKEKERSTHITDIVSDIQASFIADDMRGIAFKGLLDGLLALTQSQYGFVGELRHDSQKTPYLKMFVLSDLSWDEDTRALFQRTQESGMEFRDLDNLIGAAVRLGEIVIANDAPSDARAGGLPKGHPPLNNYMGVPLTIGGKMVGLVGLANRDGGFRQTLVAELRPVFLAAAQIVQAHKAQRSRAEAQERAEAANRAKSDFLSSMSHELRTPLNAILGFGQLLETETDPPLSDNQKVSVDHILKSGEHLLGLINEVLELARIEAGRLNVDILSVDPIGVIADSLSLIEANAQDKDLTIDNKTRDKPLPPVLTDPARLHQILLNLLSNAVKYNTPGGSITLDAWVTQPGRLKIAVTDTGIGIAAHQQDALFEPFNRLGQEQAATEGSGIGLTITKRLIEALDGDIGFDSTEGEGSTFWIDISTTDGVAAMAKKPVAPPKERAALLPVAVPQGRTLLYVEDNAANTHLMEKIVQRLAPDLTMLTALSAEKGLEMIRESAPDAIFMDIGLPGMSGLDAMEIIANDDTLKDIPVYALSANAMPKDIEAGLAVGFCDYLTKPVSVDGIRRALETLFSDDGTDA